MKDMLKVTGAVDGVITRKNGDVEEFHIPNLVVSVGKEHIAALLANSAGPTEMTRMELGTGTTIPAIDQTALTTPIVGSRKEVDSRTQNSNQVVFVGSWGATEATSEVPPISEAGIFNAGSGGDMLCRTTFEGKAKGAGDSLTLTWTITIS